MNIVTYGFGGISVGNIITQGYAGIGNYQIIQPRPCEGVLTGWCKKNLPAFYTEDFPAYQDQIDTVLAAMEATYQNFYCLLDGLPEDLDIDTARPEFLYHLGLALGVENIENLGKYLLSDGSTVDDTLISNSRFFDLLARQRTSVKFALFRYLMKGTKESIKRYFYEYSIPTIVQELWTPEPSAGPHALYPTSGTVTPEDLIVKYGSPIWSSAGSIFDFSDTWDIRAEIVTDIPSLSADTDLGLVVNNDITYGQAIPWIKDLRLSYYGYTFLLTQNGRLFYKTSVEMDSRSITSGYSPETWYEYTAGFGVAGVPSEINVIGDKLWVMLDANNLAVIDRQLELAQLGVNTPDFTINDGDVFSFTFFMDNTLVLIDRDTFVEVRDITTYQILGGKQNKPVGYSNITRNVLNKTAVGTLMEHLLVSKDAEAWTLNFNHSTNEVTSGATYSLPITNPTEDLWDIFEIDVDEFTILESKRDATPPTQYELIEHHVHFGGSTVSYTTTHTGIITDRWKNMPKYSNTVLIFTYQAEFITFELLTNRKELWAISATPRITNVFLLDRFYILDESSANLPLWKITGFTSFTSSELYKSHHINMLVDIGATSLLSFITNMSELAPFIRTNIEIVKPAHVILDTIRFILTLTQAVADTGIGDDTSLSTASSATSGASVYHMAFYEYYNGILEYKSETSAVPFLNNNDGVGGNPLRYYDGGVNVATQPTTAFNIYGGNLFQFSGATPASAFDDLIFHNIPLTN